MLTNDQTSYLLALAVWKRAELERDIKIAHSFHKEEIRTGVEIFKQSEIDFLNEIVKNLDYEMKLGNENSHFLEARRLEKIVNQRDFDLTIAEDKLKRVRGLLFNHDKEENRKEAFEIINKYFEDKL